jgi:hypothetical protein
MGIDLHALNFLRYAMGKQDLGSVLTLGRQRIYVEDRLLSGRFEGGGYRKGEFTEQLLMERYSAGSVESIDYSDYEGCTHTHDMNRQVPDSYHGRYDTIFDGGTLEHIFNAPQALKNISQMCRTGGQIIHILPANNFCGHGFWQISPELFLSLYSSANGYAETEVFLGYVNDPSRWFRVKGPSAGRRVNVKSNKEVYVLVRTVLQRRDFSHDQVQQSDYVYHWDKNPSKAGSKTGQGHNPLKRLLKRHEGLYKSLYALSRIPKRALRKPADRLDVHNPFLELVEV